MRRDELLSQIDLAFIEAGKIDSWEYRNYQNLLELKQLSHFHIFELNWFPGAARILDLIDELHSVETAREEFEELAKLLELTVDPNVSKLELAQIVKNHKEWRVKLFDLELRNKMDIRKEKLKPLYSELKSNGYETDMLPKSITHHRWILDAANKEGKIETLYLIENPDQRYIMVQSSNTEKIICIIELDTSGLIEHINDININCKF